MRRIDGCIPRVARKIFRHGRKHTVVMVAVKVVMDPDRIILAAIGVFRVVKEVAVKDVVAMETRERTEAQAAVAVNRSMVVAVKVVQDTVGPI